MAREIYNEGRVVGMSAYEIYVRQHLSENPDVEPATEKEWLASSISAGSSMLLKFKVTDHTEDWGNDDEWMYQIELPENTLLGAGNTILASFFLGEAETDESGWATCITNYGDLIKNSLKLNDSATAGDNVGTRNSILDAEALIQYMKIIDGVVLQPGDWQNTETGYPTKDLNPDLSKNPIIRLHIRGPITKEFYILFTGFTGRAVLSGVSGLDGSTHTEHPENGDFLGPAVYPWANKIIFTMPTSYVSYLLSDLYERKTPKDTEALKVNDSSIIDMKSCDPHDYYSTYSSTASQPLEVSKADIQKDGLAVLTIYQKKTNYPPALWGSYIKSTDGNSLNPIDVVAPGTVKMFESILDYNPGIQRKLSTYQSTFPGTFGLHKNKDQTLSMLNAHEQVVPIAKVTSTPVGITTVNDNGETVIENSDVSATVTQTGDLIEMSLSLTDPETENQYTISQNPTNDAILADVLKWADILAALAADRAIDILGDRLQSVKSTLIQTESTDANQCPYIEFGDSEHKKRFYISAIEPTGDIPEGSIGIGW